MSKHRTHDRTHTHPHTLHTLTCVALTAPLRCRERRPCPHRLHPPHPPSPPPLHHPDPHRCTPRTRAPSRVPSSPLLGQINSNSSPLHPPLCHRPLSPYNSSLLLPAPSMLLPAPHHATAVYSARRLIIMEFKADNDKDDAGGEAADGMFPPLPVLAPSSPSLAKTGSQPVQSAWPRRQYSG